MVLICIISGGSVTALSQRGWAGNRVFCRNVSAGLGQLWCLPHLPVGASNSGV